MDSRRLFTKMNENRKLTQFMQENIQAYNTLSWTEEESVFEQLFLETTLRNKEGRFVVRLPLKETYALLGQSKNLALDRFLKLERRFERDPLLHEQYREFMLNYLDLGHMEKINEEQIAENQAHFYFPHHPVLRPDSATTKLRTVFNGSAQTSSGLSLNDVLLTGPTIQQDIFSILLRFRCYRYGITGDIQKMFRQILVHEEDRRFQLILWRFSLEEPISTYQLNTVTYGTCSAPFTAARCLKQLAIEFQSEFPEACKIIEKDFYMDDVLFGHEDEQKLILLKEQLTRILKSAGFELHNWKCNDPKTVIEEQNTSTKILGLQWNTFKDLLSITNEIDIEAGTTKRNILAEVQKIFDPLGVISPVVVQGKILMQNIWSHKLQWDEKLPNDIISEWTWFCKQICDLKYIQFPRYTSSSGQFTELHGFSDAAKRAYGAAIYVRTVAFDGKVTVHLMCAKSRVTPQSANNNNNDLTIPRLELRAAVSLVELMDKVRSALTIPIQGIHYWTDSMVTLDWIANPNRSRPQFVSNRVKIINEKTKLEAWHHVRSKDNPADLISRGSSAKKLINNQLWWNGPIYLREDNKKWNFESTLSLKTTVQIQRSTNDTDSPFAFIEKVSNLGKLQRIAAYCLRFVQNCRSKSKPGDRLTGKITIWEIRRAHKTIIKTTQQRFYAEEISCIKKKKPLSGKSVLLTLNPFIDVDGLMRVDGRIQAAGISFDQQHPIILPPKSNFTQVVVRNYHLSYLHIGPQSLLYTVRLKYWVPKGKSLTRKIIHQCMTCFRNKPKPLNQIMGEIPEVRLNPGKPFKECGVDFGGPFIIKENFVRTQKTLKVYVALFICLKTRAVHLELVSSLTSASFIAALRRFSEVRGRSAIIYCDNATNFTGSKNEIKSLKTNFKCQVEPDIQDFCTNEGVDWKFIPPRSPAFGGIWEAGIKSVKYHLRRVLGSSTPTYEEMLTLMKQIEGCLNSRPISPISSASSDPIPLTPGHFLIGEPITAMPEEDLITDPPKLLNRFEQVQRSVQLFWKRWQMEYLNNLQQRTKGLSTAKPDLLVGQLCLVKEENLPPCVWITGRVTKVHPGPDGHVRVASLKTPRGEIKRSIAKLCPLPVE
ncbi:uncharacterized protein LOC129757284 isoform X1 [Uranotaenia lowii]|uniref:uncharacterized protein LOC129757284 isoform X1 n=1 Tax=Uranotaenia lowii TaxID=190385 RepID=UPI00247A0948|nr:uncharacterized protein LOC129757284 isoform X1 [Uranotaenia lowii]